MPARQPALVGRLSKLSLFSDVTCVGVGVGWGCMASDFDIPAASTVVEHIYSE